MDHHVLDSKGYCCIVVFLLYMFDNRRVTFFVLSSIRFELGADKQTVRT